MMDDPILVMALGISFLGCVISMVAGGLFLRTRKHCREKVLLPHRQSTLKTWVALPEKAKKQTNIYYGGGVLMRGTAPGYAVVSKITVKQKEDVIYAASQELVASAWKNRAFVAYDSGGGLYTSLVSL